MADQARHVKKYRIKKGDTVKVIQGKESGKSGKVMHVLEGEERIGEVARMLGGKAKLSVDHARELLESART